MTDQLNSISITQAFDDFLGLKADDLTRRTLRKYGEVLGLLGEFLEEHGVTTLERGPKGAAALREILQLIEVYNDEYLIQEIDAERDFLRVAATATGELGRWLKSQGWARRSPGQAPSYRSPAAASA